MKTTRTSIEPLEARIAPAALATLRIVNPHLVTYTDVDGDKVSVSISAGTFTSEIFDGAAGALGEQLRVLDLSAGGFDGANLVFKVSRVAGGDGFVDVGSIKSTGHNLGNVLVAGDLGQIDAGSDDPRELALKSLSVRSLGVRGLETQFEGSLESDIRGSVGALSVSKEIRDAVLRIGSSTTGTLGAVIIGGSLSYGAILATGSIGPVKVGGAILFSTISSDGRIGAVSVGGSMHLSDISSAFSLGAVAVRGDFSDSALRASEGKLASFTLGGSFIETAENPLGLGWIGAIDIGPVKIGGDMNGGGIFADGDIQNVTIGGSFFGNSNDTVGGQISSARRLGPVVIGHDLRDGANIFGGSVERVFVRGSVVGVEISGGELKLVQVGGSLIDATISALGADDGIGFTAPANIGSVRVTGAMIDSFIMQGDKFSDAPDGRLGSVTVGKSLVGGGISGAIIGTVTIGGDLRGGETEYSGVIEASDGLGSVTIHGSLVGGAGAGSGTIIDHGEYAKLADAGSVRIRGGMEGGDGAYSGSLFLTQVKSIAVEGAVTGGSIEVDRAGVIRFGASVSATLIGGRDIAQLEVFGDVRDSQIGYIPSGATPTPVFRGIHIGGSLERSSILAGEIVSVQIEGDLRGGPDLEDDDPTLGSVSEIHAVGTLGAVRIAGSMIGAEGAGSASISAGTMIGSVTVGGSVLGGGGEKSGRIYSQGLLGSVRVGGSLLGGAGGESGVVESVGGTGAVVILGNLAGGTGDSSGLVSSQATVGAVGIGGSIEGGAGAGSGGVQTAGGSPRPGSIGKVNVGRDLRGHGASDGGFISSAGAVGPVTIGGSLIGGAGGGGIFGGGGMGAIKIGGDILGADSLSSSGYIDSYGHIASIAVGGSIVSGYAGDGTLVMNGAIRGGSIGALTVRGSILGNASAPVTISASGEDSPTQTRDLAIGSIRIDGDVERAQILAGYARANTAEETGVAFYNGNAQIGSVVVMGDWIASSLVAGVRDAGSNGFGNADDAGTTDSIARIAAIGIGGVIVGSTAPGDHFGFVAHQIGSFRSQGFTAPLTAAPNAPIELAMGTADVTIREI